MASSAPNGSSSRTTSGLGGQRAGHRDALALAAGQLARPAVAHRRRLEPDQARAPGRRSAGRVGHARGATAPAPRCGARASAAAGRRPAARSPMRRRSATGSSAGGVGAVDQHGARVGIGQPVEAAEQRRLARAALADQRDALAAARPRARPGRARRPGRSAWRPRAPRARRRRGRSIGVNLPGRRADRAARDSRKLRGDACARWRDARETLGTRSASGGADSLGSRARPIV